MDEVRAPAGDAVAERDQPDACSAPLSAWPRVGLLSGAAGALAACAGADGSDGVDGQPAAPQRRASAVAPAPAEAGDVMAAAARFLLQAQFSATDAEIESVLALGYDGWLSLQHGIPERRGCYDWLVAVGYTTNVPESGHQHWVDRMIWHHLIAAPGQMRQRLTLALSEMFVVSASSMCDRWPACFMGAYWDVLSQNVFGNFRALLHDVTLNAAMGRYLNTYGNERENEATGRRPDENYARELMQLFTIGLVQLQPDGTPAPGAPSTYTEEDVRNLARVFTGYDLDMTGTSMIPWSPEYIQGPERARNPMVLDPSKHSSQPVSFLGCSIAAGTPGAAALATGLDALFNHPNVGPFFARQMIQRLVTSNPSPEYVGRVAAVFDNNGSRVRGDMKAFWRAILLDPEARTVSTSPRAGKVREPMVRAIQWARTFNATSIDGLWRVPDQSATEWGLAQSPLRSPSVFNFFRPGYVPPNTGIAGQAGMVAPEFQLHNESSIVGYLNYLRYWISQGFGEDGSIKANYDFLMDLAADAPGLVDWMNIHLTGRQLSADTVATIVGSLNSYPVSGPKTKLNRIHAAILLVMSSPEYIVQK